MNQRLPGPRMPWPMPALASWAASWAVLMLAWRALHLPPVWAVLLAAGLALVLSLREPMRWRRALIAGGFPLSLAASGVLVGVPPWAWLLPLALLALVYPMQTWRDAPLFPTPVAALGG